MFDQVGEPGPRVGVDSGFIGPSLGEPIAAVVEKQHVAAELHQRGGVGQAMGGVARVSMEEENGPGGAWVRQEEGVDAHAVLREDANVLPRDAELLRPEVHSRLRVEDHAVDEPVPHEDEEYHTEEGGGDGGPAGHPPILVCVRPSGPRNQPRKAPSRMATGGVLQQPAKLRCRKGVA